ncbi:hypothetical protein [Bacillus sp. FJAT-44742]|uniref:hypothetical protein n=1 Tax=Bacillus sp. FJAT-44742 TaxID=2014005 RepID=UPI0018E1F5D0|nr:hypothetical protein [Bacillus sp. FJAT-44742]
MPSNNESSVYPMDLVSNLQENDVAFAVNDFGEVMLDLYIVLKRDEKGILIQDVKGGSCS